MKDYKKNQKKIQKKSQKRIRIKKVNKYIKLIIF